MPNKPYKMPLRDRLDQDYVAYGGYKEFVNMMNQLSHLSRVTRDETIARHFNVAPITVWRWRKEYNARMDSLSQ